MVIEVVVTFIADEDVDWLFVIMNCGFIGRSFPSKCDLGVERLFDNASLGDAG